MEPVTPSSLKLLPCVPHHARGCGRHMEAPGRVSQNGGRWQARIPPGQGRTEQIPPASPSLPFFALITTCVLCYTLYSTACEDLQSAYTVSEEFPSDHNMHQEPPSPPLCHPHCLFPLLPPPPPLPPVQGSLETIRAHLGIHLLPPNLSLGVAHLSGFTFDSKS